MAGSLPAVVVVVIVIVVVVVVVVVIVVIADAVVIVDAVVVVVISTSRSKVASIQFSRQKSKVEAKPPTNKKPPKKLSVANQILIHFCKQGPLQ